VGEPKEEGVSQIVSQGSGYPVNEDFDPLDPDYLADPYPYYARFRSEMPIFYAPKIDFWVVSRYEDIQRVVKDPAAFSNARCRSRCTRSPPRRWRSSRRACA